MGFKEFLLQEDFNPQEESLLRTMQGSKVEDFSTNQYYMYLIRVQAPWFPIDYKVQVGFSKKGLSNSPNPQEDTLKLTNKLNQWLSTYTTLGISALNPQNAPLIADFLRKLNYNVIQRSAPDVGNYFIIRRK